MKKYTLIIIAVLLSNSVLAVPQEKPVAIKNAFADLADGPAGPGQQPQSGVEAFPDLAELTRVKFDFRLEQKPKAPVDDKPEASQGSKPQK